MRGIISVDFDSELRNCVLVNFARRERSFMGKYGMISFLRRIAGLSYMINN